MNKNLKLFVVVCAILIAVSALLIQAEKASGTGIGRIAAQVAKAAAGPND